LFALKWPFWRGYLGSWDTLKWLLPLWGGGRCREVKTRMNVWIVIRDTKKVMVVESWPSWRGGYLSGGSTGFSENAHFILSAAVILCNYQPQVTFN